jgi:hypothetical protein
MKATFRIKFVGGEERTVTTSPVDIVRTEAYTNKSIGEGTPSLTQMFYVAYSAARRAGIAGQDFEKWLETVEAIDDASEAGDPKEQPQQD